MTITILRDFRCYRNMTIIIVFTVSLLPLWLLSFKCKLLKPSSTPQSLPCWCSVKYVVATNKITWAHLRCMRDPPWVLIFPVLLDLLMSSIRDELLKNAYFFVVWRASTKTPPKSPLCIKLHHTIRVSMANVAPASSSSSSSSSRYGAAQPELSSALQSVPSWNN